MMNCLCVVAPTDEEILAYALDGEILPTAAEEHLGHCVICQQRLARYESANNFLVQSFYRSQCPATTTLLQYCHGLLSSSDELGITRHLTLCPLCASDVTETRHLIRSSALLPDTNTFFPVKPSSSGGNMVLESYRNAPEPIQSDTSALRVASIWPMKYRANTTELLLQVNYNCHGGIALAGTLLRLYPGETGGNAPTFVGVKAELYYAMALTDLEECLAYKADQPLLYSERPLFTALVDEPGTFKFPSVPPGKYLFIVHLPDTAMVIEELCILA